MAHAHVLPDDAVRRLSGLEQLRGIIEGTLPSPTMGTTLGFRIVEVSEGRAVFEGTPGEAAMNPLGTVHGGWAASVLDSALGCAVHTTMAPGERYTTLEIKVNLTRAILPGAGPLLAIGTIVYRGRRTATSEARLTDAAGKLYAHGTCTCLMLPPAA